MNLRCPCGSPPFNATFVRDELQTLCPRCSRFFDRQVQGYAPCWEPPQEYDARAIPTASDYRDGFDGPKLRIVGDGS